MGADGCAESFTIDPNRGGGERWGALVEEDRTRDDERLTYSPAEVAERLGIPPSTLRTYAGEFAPLLSTDARGQRSVTGQAFRHRRYTLADVAVLERAKELLSTGLSYRAALAQLSGDRFSISVIPPRRSPRREHNRRGRPRLTDVRGAIAEPGQQVEPRQTDRSPEESAQIAPSSTEMPWEGRSQTASPPTDPFQSEPPRADLTQSEPAQPPSVAEPEPSAVPDSLLPAVVSENMLPTNLVTLDDVVELREMLIDQRQSLAALLSHVDRLAVRLDRIEELLQAEADQSEPEESHSWLARLFRWGR